MVTKYSFENLIKIVNNTDFDNFLKQRSDFALEGTTNIDITSFGDAFIVIKKIYDDSKKPVKPVFMGNLSHLNIADVFSMINMLQKTGMLIIKASDRAKSVYFMKGEIVFASSNQPEDRLGYLLYKTGKLTKEQWENAEKSMTPDTRFGTVLLKKELISPKNLWWGVKYQIEEIVYSIFAIASGEFFFIEGAIPEEDLVRFSLNTQNMLMEGYRRLDEWKLIKEKIPSDDALVKLSTNLPNIELTQNMQAVVKIIKGDMPIAEVIRQSQIGRFNAYKILYALLNTGFIEIVGAQKQEQAVDETTIKTLTMIRKYNNMFRKLFGVIKSTNPKFNHNELLDNFVSELSERLKKLYENVEISTEGELDESKLLMNVDSMKLTESDSLNRVVGLAGLLLSQLMLEGMNEFLNYEIFIAKNLLHADVFEKINKEIRALQNEN
jgi:predicted transcriptional regulator